MGVMVEHCRCRARQRGIRREIVELAVNFGRYVGGMSSERVLMLEDLMWLEGDGEISHLEFLRFSRQVPVVVIVLQGRAITTYRPRGRSGGSGIVSKISESGCRRGNRQSSCEDEE